MILFLDFDGVLHPDEVYLVRGRPMLRDEGHLFMWAPLLEDALSPFPDVQIVLSTSWVQKLNFRRASNFLPEALRRRIIGATWHSKMAEEIDYSHWWNAATRHQQIRRYVNRAELTNWIAIDDDGEGWSTGDANKLILTDSQKGLSDAKLLLQLSIKLRLHDD